ncbi:hypothetical protein CA234_15360 [Sphingomonas sp. ABOLE]|uniref:hypothetical protein n=1 Tax=Sphingomonas sp. ABOLE TaxID=1985878 RepID=UPI000F7DEE45|nr:hypothetical protein [Sphingomonas sp. ABOLE]RSV39463.1 hypothetical protein CA234_15360 [Sphingomonas sp. ABOLE]
MKRLLSVAVLATALWTIPAEAKAYRFIFNGSVYLVEGDASGTGVRTGDAIRASFVLDDASATLQSKLAVGGGIYSIYAVPLTGFRLSIGTYSVNQSVAGGSLVYMDQSFGADGIVVSTSGLPGGPFDSTFTNVQFQARGPTSAIDGSGIGNGFPYDRFEPSFVAFFGNGKSVERVWGSYSLASVSAVPECNTWGFLLAGFGLIGLMMRFRCGGRTLANR